jgi:hypothetical protein
MKQVTVLTVFVASPSDVVEERDSLEYVIREINTLWESSRRIRLELVRWETHAYPGVSSDPQAVINEQLCDSCDIFIGILWKKFGTPTPRADSGTEEEFQRAYDDYLRSPNDHRIMIYFKMDDVGMVNIDLPQLAKVFGFKESLPKKGALYWDFRGLTEFQSLLRLHLTRCVDDYGKSWGNTNSKFECQQLDVVVQDIEESSDDEGFLDLIEDMELGFSDMTEQIDRINTATIALGNKISERATEFEDIRLQGGEFDLKRVKRVCNNAAEHLETYADLLDVEMPTMSSRFAKAVESYARAAALLKDFSSSRDVTLESIDASIASTMSLQAVMSSAAGHVEDFRNIVSAQPRMTTQYNAAKKHALNSLAEYIRVLITGADRMTELQSLLSRIREDVSCED